jgi:dolichol-phosphate mannosyltransferase/undecaprenyl-phosphate 4-deoxy-4-formamido-L-arabinose transferase
VITVLEASVAGSFEIVLVNDDSGDETWEIIEKLAAQDRRVHGIDLLRNTGQFRALACGLAHSVGEVVVTLDDDLQHPPEEIPKLLDELDRHPELDAVVGEYGEKRHGIIRNLGTRIMAAIFSSAYGKPKDLKMGSFRALRRPVVDGMLAFGTIRPIPGALLLQTTRRISNVRVEHHARTRGASGQSLGSMIGSVLDNVLHSSTVPLRLMSAAGFLIAGVAAILLVFYLVRSIVGSVLPGFTTLVLLTAFFGGTTLLAIGVLGEYVARLVAEATRPPKYIVRNTTDAHDG